MLRTRIVFMADAGGGTGGSKSIMASGAAMSRLCTMGAAQ